VLASDPRAPRLTLPQRRQRLVGGMTHALERIDTCLARGAESPGPAQAAVAALRVEVRAFEPKLHPRAMREALETIDLGVDLLYRAEQAITQHCGPPTDLDRAWLLIGRRYSSQER
jgi:antitoxin component HigA of HigAB toxin-antitoxin module